MFYRHIAYLLTFCQQISRWFQYHGTKSLKSSQVSALTRILNGFWQKHQKPPRRVGIIQYYQRLYYKCRIKSVVDTLYPTLVQAASLKGEPCPKQVVVQNQITTEYYKAETQEFKDLLEEQRRADYEESYAVWQAGMSDNESGKGRSAQHYHE